MNPSLTRSMQANTTTTISSSGSGTNLILTAKVSPAGVTGSVVFYAGPIDNGIQLATIFLVNGVARLSRFPQGGTVRQSGSLCSLFGNIRLELQRFQHDSRETTLMWILEVFTVWERIMLSSGNIDQGAV